MDFEFGEKEQKLRAEIRQFVKENVPLNQVPYFEEHDDEEWAFSMSITRKLAPKGWLTISWPKEYGGMGASEWERAVYLEEVGYWGIPGWSMGIGGIGWVGPHCIYRCRVSHFSSERFNGHSRDLLNGCRDCGSLYRKARCGSKDLTTLYR